MKTMETAPYLAMTKLLHEAKDLSELELSQWLVIDSQNKSDRQRSLYSLSCMTDWSLKKLMLQVKSKEPGLVS